MAIHCKQGDKPIIKYRFGGDTKDRIFKNKFAPIEVVTRTVPLQASDNFSTNGFELTWREFVNSTTFKTIVLDYKIWTIPQPHPTGYGITVLACGQKWSNMARNYTANLYSNGYGFNYLYHPSVISIDYSKNCGGTITGRCSIEIKHNGLVIHQDQGNCPVSFSVQCGKCPDGQHECKTNVYPYYCCTSCQETAGRINDLTNKVGRGKCCG